MSFIITIKKQFIQFIAIVILLNFASCSSFQYAGTYEDSIYSESNPEELEEETNNPSNASLYYENYFKEKSLNFEGDSSTYTDSDSYEGDYSKDTESDDYAGWGQNNSSDITINIYDTTPFYGNWGGSPFFNNWNRNMGWNMGWNLGWSNYGYVMDPFGNNYGYQYIPWGNNYWNYGFPNYGYYGFPNYGYNGYYGYGRLNNNRGSSVSYVNGPRVSRNANNISGRRSASESSILKKLTTRSTKTSRNLNNSRKYGVTIPANIALALDNKNISESKKKESKKTSSRKKSSTRQNTRPSNNNSTFPKAVKRTSVNSSYSRPSTTRSSGASSRVSGGTSSRRKR
jgi:hypothetical protein